MKEMWKTIKKFWPYLNKSNISPAAQEALSNHFNAFFTSVGPDLASKIRPDHPTRQALTEHQPPIFEFEQITHEIIVEVIKDLFPTNSCSTDKITLRLLKAAGPSIIPCITHICNMSIRYHTFPDVWKIAVVTPLHKSGDTSKPTNYRPISVLPCLGKILERVIHTQLYNYLTVYELIAPQQSGFRKG